MEVLCIDSLLLAATRPLAPCLALLLLFRLQRKRRAGANRTPSSLFIPAVSLFETIGKYGTFVHSHVLTLESDYFLQRSNNWAVSFPQPEKLWTKCSGGGTTSCEADANDLAVRHLRHYTCEEGAKLPSFFGIKKKALSFACVLLVLLPSIR